MNFVHRDIKHDNIVVHSDGHFALADFGLAHPDRLDQRPSGWCGTMGYTAPEVIGNGLFGSVYYDKKADIWSLGLVFLEAFLRCKDPIYSGRDREHAAFKTLTLEPTQLPEMQIVRMSNEVLFDLLAKVCSIRFFNLFFEVTVY